VRNGANLSTRPIPGADNERRSRTQENEERDRTNMNDSTIQSGISITDQAVAAVKEAIRAESRSPETTFLRVGVRAGGCSGYSYDLSFTDQREDEDLVIEQGGVRLLLDPRSEMLLRGTILDYSSGLNGKGFVFTNPNATGTCGCGESFSV